MDAGSLGAAVPPNERVTFGSFEASRVFCGLELGLELVLGLELGVGVVDGAFCEHPVNPRNRTISRQIIAVVFLFMLYPPCIIIFTGCFICPYKGT